MAFFIFWWLMNLTDLRTFVMVLDETSLTRAASRLGRTQPAVTVAIQRLESAAGTTLLIRDRGAVRLTSAGERLAAYARRIVDMAAEAHAAIVNLRQIGRTELLVGANDSLAGVALPLIDTFRQQRPDTRVDLKRTRSRDVAGLVRKGDLDVGLAMDKPEAEDLQSIVLARDEFLVVVPPSHEFASRSCLRLRDVAEQPLIAHNEPSPDRTRVLALLDACGVKHRIVLGVPTLDALKRAVEAGMGITIMSRRCVLTEVQQRRLVAIPLDGPAAGREIWLVARSRATMSQTAAAFVDLALRTIRDTEPARAALLHIRAVTFAGRRVAAGAKG